MTNIIPVSQGRHGRKGWRRPNGYGFVANVAVVPLGGSEFGQAVGALPIGFIQRLPGSYMPVAITALSKGTNAFVGPGGQWLGTYVPAVLRSYPFSLIPFEDGSGQKTLGIDEDSGLVVDGLTEGAVERFYEPDGTPTPIIKSITELLQFIERDQLATDRAVAALAEADVIKVWPLTVQVGNQQMTVNGLYGIDEAALNTLDDATFLRLRRASSLVLAYGHLLSVPQVGVVSRLTLFRQLPIGPVGEAGSDMLPV